MNSRSFYFGSVLLLFFIGKFKYINQIDNFLQIAFIDSDSSNE